MYFPESAAELPFHIDHIIAEKHGGIRPQQPCVGLLLMQPAQRTEYRGIDPESGVLTRRSSANRQWTDISNGTV